jgi:CDP-diacylglycerol--glycerol-3-phosphate 3-phosphatidyltransferase
MLFMPVFSYQFYLLYLLCGFTDMIDGIIARKTKSVTHFGSVLDSVADFVFVAAAFIKLLPALNIPIWLWNCIFVVALVKIINLTLGFLRNRRLTVEHTAMNRFTGFLLFLLPLTISFIDLKYSGNVVCAIAACSAIQEGYYIKTGREVA